MDKKTIIRKLVLSSLLVLSFLITTTTASKAAFGQELTIERPNIDPNTGIFTSEQDVFRLKISTAWVIQDLDTNAMMATELELVYGFLAHLFDD